MTRHAVPTTRHSFCPLRPGPTMSTSQSSIVATVPFSVASRALVPCLSFSLSVSLHPSTPNPLQHPSLSLSLVIFRMRDQPQCACDRTPLLNAAVAAADLLGRNDVMVIREGSGGVERQQTGLLSWRLTQMLLSVE